MTSEICLVLGGHWSAARGGAPFQAACLADRIVERGHVSLSYIARTIDTSAAQSYATYKVASPAFLHRFGFSVDAPWLYGLLRKVRPKVIYQRGLQSYTGLCAAYASRNRCQFVYHVAHDYDVTPRVRHETSIHTGPALIEKSLGEYGLRHADHIVVQSRQQADLLRSNYGLRASKVVKNFHPGAAQVGLRKPATPIEIAWVGNLKPLKRPELFVELASSFLGNSAVKFTMVGAGLDQPRYSKLRARVEKLSNLEYTGKLEQDDVNGILSRAHLLVCTSRSEGFPNTFIQAWRRGAVVVSLGIDPDGVLSKCGAGLSCDDIPSLHRAINSLSADPSLRERIAAEAYTYVESSHSMRNADELAGFLESLAVKHVR